MAELNCDYNQLTALPALPASLSQLTCDSNQLTGLPVLPASMTILSCSYNHNLTCLPRLTFINNLYFKNTAVTCLPNYGVVFNSSPSLNSIPLCNPVNNPWGCQIFWNISGQTYFDRNNNCLFDSLDVGTAYVKTLLYSGGNLIQQVFTGGEGFYSFGSLPHGSSYTVHVDTSYLPFTINCPDSDYFTVTISNADSLSDSNSFAFKCRTTGYDVGAHSIINTGPTVRPNTTFTLATVAGDISELYGAHCASGINGQVQILYSGQVKYIGTAQGALLPTSVNGNTITWNIADFGIINDFTSFNLLFKADSLATPGQLCFTATVTPTGGDYNVANNSLSYCFNIVDALDPNEKEVYPTHIDSAGQWLTYTIRFQNTGNAPALNIRVTDTLSSCLDASTFQLLAYSAKNVTQLFGNNVVFNFPNINLPDSATSDSTSRGFVQYRVKTKSPFTQTEKISNTAYIYFDLNPAVITNTVVDSVAHCQTTTANISPTICTGDTFYIANKPFTQAGNYTDTIMNAGGCDSIITLHLTVNQRPVSIAFYDTAICSGSTIPIGYTATPGYTYAWNPSTGLDSANVSDPTLTIYTTTDTVVKYLVTTGYMGCYSSDSVTIAIAALPVVSFSFDSMIISNELAVELTDTVFCIGSANQLTLKGGKWGLHSTASAYSGNGVANNILTINGPGVYPFSFTGYNALGCPVSVKDTIVAEICEGISQLSATSSITIYPNPATDQLFIQTSNIQPQTTTIYDVNGRIIYTMPFKPGADVKQLSSGVYFVEVQSNSEVARKMFVKM